MFLFWSSLFRLSKTYLSQALDSYMQEFNDLVLIFTKSNLIFGTLIL